MPHVWRVVMLLTATAMTLSGCLWGSSGDGSVAHLQNWIDCIRSRKLPVADVEIGHRSVSVCHLANIARAAGRTLRWDPKNESFLDDAEANQLLTRKRRAGFELPV